MALISRRFANSRRRMSICARPIRRGGEAGTSPRPTPGGTIMELTANPNTLAVPSRTAAVWIGRSLSGLVSAFLLVDGAMKLFKPDMVVKATLELGYPESSIVGIGLTLL